MPCDDCPRPAPDRVAITVVEACLRQGAGGSPTAVVWDTGLDERFWMRIPRHVGTSHAVIIAPPSGPDDRSPVPAVRFFTADDELAACGHGTIAALAFLADHARTEDYRTVLQTPARRFAADAARTGTSFTAGFDPGQVALRAATRRERELGAHALRPGAGVLDSEICVASIGRPRLMVPVASAAALRELSPDMTSLRQACDELGLLGCYCYTAMSAGRVAARMFAPSIGVPEDIANANSSACLAALLAREGIAQVAVDMGDSLGRPSTIVTSASEGGGRGQRLRVTGAAAITATVEIPLWALSV
jgi:trans-2,3-dihydro-3-hydroxyanthranilate isomerase